MKSIGFLLLLFPFLCRSQTISIVAHDSAICIGSAARFTATVAGIVHPHFQWQVNGVNAGTDSSAYNPNTLSNSDTISCLLTNVAHDSVFAASDNIVISVQHAPHAGVITGTDSFVCVGATTVLIDTVPGGVWATASSHCSVAGGTVRGIYDGGFECPAPYHDTVFYTVSNSCGADTARYRIRINAFPSAYFELHDGPYIYLFDAVICVPPVPQGFHSGLTPTNGTTESMCGEGEMHSKHGYIDADIYGWSGVKPGVDTVVNVSTNICGTATYEMQVTVIDKPRAATITKSIDKLCVGERDSIVVPGSSSCFANSNASVTFHNGVANITGSSPGPATITIRATNTCGSTDTSILIDVMVTPSMVPGTDSLCKGYPMALYDSIPGGLWSTDMAPVADINPTSGIVSGVGDGVATIKYSLPDGCAVSRDIVVSDCEKEVEVYPNPSSDEVTIHLYVSIYNSYAVFNTLACIIHKKSEKSLVSLR